MKPSWTTIQLFYLCEFRVIRKKPKTVNMTQQKMLNIEFFPFCVNT